jgi:hypothetical protein
LSLSRSKFSRPLPEPIGAEVFRDAVQPKIDEPVIAALGFARQG